LLVLPPHELPGTVRLALIRSHTLVTTPLGGTLPQRVPVAGVSGVLLLPPLRPLLSSRLLAPPPLLRAVWAPPTGLHLVQGCSRSRNLGCLPFWARVTLIMSWCALPWKTSLMSTSFLTTTPLGRVGLLIPRSKLLGAP
jgi:hypothetical protein